MDGLVKLALALVGPIFLAGMLGSFHPYHLLPKRRFLKEEYPRVRIKVSSRGVVIFFGPASVIYTIFWISQIKAEISPEVLVAVVMCVMSAVVVYLGIVYKSREADRDFGLNLNVMCLILSIIAGLITYFHIEDALRLNTNEIVRIGEFVVFISWVIGSFVTFHGHLVISDTILTEKQSDLQMTEGK